MIGPLRDVDRWLWRYYGPLMLVGLAVVGWYNRQLWRRDMGLLPAAASRESLPDLREWPRTPMVSVLVAAWNESQNIDAHISSFLALGYPKIEMILRAGGSDDTLDRAFRYAETRVVVLEQDPGEGKQRALAHCLERASGEIIYLTDADCIYDEDALTRLLAPLVFEDEQVATGVSRPLDTQLGQLLPFHLWSAEMASSARWGRYIEGLLGRNTVVTRRALDASGGLDFAARTGTDYHLARRLRQHGFVIRYIGASVVPSAYPDSIPVYRQKQSRWLRNLLIHGRRYGAIADIRLTQRTMATGLVMAVSPLLSLVFGSSVLVAWALLVAHACAAKVRYAYFTAMISSRSLPDRYLLSVLPLTLLDFLVWALPIIDYLDPRRRERW